ncbi:hypothetical protein M8494_16610 [Serratia ureilytica]
MKASKRDLRQNVLATGQLDAVRKVDVGARSARQLEKLYVEIGDKVKKGQLLGVIDPQQAQNSIREGEATLRELHAQLLQAQAEQQLAAVTLQRNQALAKLQAVSRHGSGSGGDAAGGEEGAVGTINAQIARNGPAWIPPRSAGLYPHRGADGWRRGAVPHAAGPDGDRGAAGAEHSDAGGSRHHAGEGAGVGGRRH